MCLILFAYRSHQDFPLILAANRDERYDRPTAPAAFWQDSPKVLAGRDMKAGGSWLGITRQGKFAAITNLRGGANTQADLISRGHLVSDFLVSDVDPVDYCESVVAKADRYNGFNLLIGDKKEFVYCNNDKALEILTPGIYGLSNHKLNSPWPKVIRGKESLEKIIQKHSNTSPINNDQLLSILGDKSIAGDHELPNTGIDIELERTLSPMFIESETYGTCLSTSIIINSSNQVQFKERSFYEAPFGDKSFSFIVD
ncbi:NRDE family protein [Aurantivibrio infirmus]